MKRLAHLSVAVLAIAIASPVQGDILWFADEFDGASLDPAVWDVQQRDGSVYVQDGWVYFETEGQQNLFPYAYVKANPFPVGDLRFETRVQFLGLESLGSGVACTDTLWHLNVQAEYRCTFRVWGDEYLKVYVCEELAYIDSSYLMDTHEYAFTLSGTAGEAYMDSGFIGSGYSDRRPIYLILGNSVPSPPPSAPDYWCNMRVDYVRIWQVCSPSTVEHDSWSGVKSLFR